MNKENENLDELFGQFYEDEQAKEVAEDIRQGEQILRDNPSPQPTAELLADIKSKMAIELSKKPRRGYSILLKFAAAAAVILIAVLATHNFVDQQPKSTTLATVDALPRAVWESDDLSIDDKTLADLSADIEDLEQQILALNDYQNGEEFFSTDEIEMELLDISSDFWKG